MLHARHQRFVWIWGPGALIFLALFSNTALGQRMVIQRNHPEIGGETSETGAAFVTSREMTQRLKTAKERIIEKDYLTGVRYLQSLLDEREDWFIEESPAANPPQNPGGPAGDSERKPNFQSLKNAVEEVVGNLPAEAARTYEQEYGFSAKAMLKEAAQTGDLAKLSELGRRFFHTEAGYEAVYRLGLLKSDHGEPFAAALHFGRLKAHAKAAGRFEPLLSLQLAMCWEEAGFPAQSERVLKQLKKDSPQGQVRIGGRNVPLFDRNENARGWLAQVLAQNSAHHLSESENWPMFRGNASRNANSATASPIGPVAWSRATILDEDSFGLTRGQLARVENELHHLAESRKQDDKHLFPLPVAQPLISGRRAIFRTMQNIQAVDLQTGETLWKTAHADSRLRPVLSHASAERLQEQMIQRRMALPNGNMNRNASDQRSALETFLTQRIWRDTTFGLLSGDSQRVYSIEEVGLADGMYFAKPSSDDPFLPKTYNKLMAFDITGGRAEWEAGGPPADKDPLSDTFFLGPPLPIGEQLFCLGERNNEISLLAMDASTGQLEWEQRLVLPALSLLANRERRVMGLSPAFGEGVMICPTASGAVVAVDVTRRMLLWAYEYESNQTEDYLVANMAWQRGGALQFSHESIHPEARWADSVPVVAEGKVLITPSDSHELHCLDLSTGELQWMVERGEGLYLAGVEKGLAILVSRSQVRGLQLTDGRDAWKTPVAIPTPAGRGFIADGKFHLPLASGEVGTIDLQQGRLIARSPWPEDQAPGNLVSAGGRVVFQSPDAIGAFSSWDQMTADIETALKTNPNDAEALATRGVFRLHQGDEAEALEDLRRAWKIKPTENTRSLIVSRMLEGLRTDPSRYQAHREELRQMIQSSEETLQFLMLTVSSKKTPEARAEAFRDYVELAQILAGKPALVKISESHQVRGDAWVKARIEQLSANADQKELAEWDRILEKELPAVLKGLPADSRLQVLSSFPRLPTVEKAELAILPEFGKEENLLAKSILLERLRKSQDERTSAQATLALAEIHLQAGREGEAYPLIQELGKKWPNAWREDFNSLKPPQTPDWPDRKLHAELHARGAEVLPEIPIRLESAAHSPYANWSFSIDQQSRRLIARDENGSEGWHLDIAETNGPVLELGDITLSLYGHLGVLSFKTHFAVLDLMSQKHTAKVLWWSPLMEGGIDADELYRLEQFQRNRQFGLGGVSIVVNHIGWVKLLNEELIVYQVGERITAADAVTGKPRWVRESVRRQSRIFGDENFLAVVAPDGISAFIARTADGEVLRMVNLPPLREQVAFQGMNLVSWKTVKDQQILESRQLHSDKLNWTRACPKGTTLRKVGEEEMALFQPDGRFLIISLAEGTPKVDAKLEWGEDRLSHEVCRVGSRYLLLSRNDLPVRARRPFLAEPTWMPVDGPLHVFDRVTGKLLWKTQIEDQNLEKPPPYNSPVIVFNKLPPPGAFGGLGNKNNVFRVRVLDLRTGDMIYEHNQLPNASPLRIRVHPAEKKVTVTFREGEIEVKSTQEPLKSSGT